MNYVKKAEEIARKAHKDQKRWGGEPYIIHPEWIVKQIKKNKCYFGEGEFRKECIVTAWLHDVVEDTNIDIISLVRKGFSVDIIEAIISITKGKKEDYLEYILRVSENPIGRVVKIIDIEHNMLSILEDTNKMRMDRYKLAKYILEK